MVYFQSSTLPLAGGSNVNIWIILINSDIIDDTYKLKQRTQALHLSNEHRSKGLVPKTGPKTRKSVQAASKV